MISAISPRTPAPPSSTSRSAALERQDERSDVAPLTRGARRVLRQLFRDLPSTADRPERAAFGLNRNRLGRLAGVARGLDQRLGDHLLAPERDDEHGRDIGMAAIGRQRLVRRVHVGPQLPAARQVRQGDHRRGQRFGDPLADHRRTDHRRHHEHVIAHAHATVGTWEPEEARPVTHAILPAT
jgi:hypothetical protein